MWLAVTETELGSETHLGEHVRSFCHSTARGVLNVHSENMVSFIQMGRSRVLGDKSGAV